MKSVVDTYLEEVAARIAERFWSKVNKNGPVWTGHGKCWLWCGSIHVRSGYGQFPIGRKTYRAHRIAWELENGAIPNPALHILHGCNNRLCVRPSHLRPGTPLENADDRSRNGHELRRRRRISATLKGKAKTAAHIANLPQNRKGYKRKAA